jgi:hypothetical protein
MWVMSMQSETANLNEIFKTNKVIVFGTGKYSEYFSDLDINVAYYIDNDARKWGTLFNKKKVEDPDTLLMENKDTTIIIIASMYHEAISHQLRQYGFEENVQYFKAEDIILSLCSNSLRNVRRYKNIHLGERAFIIGNGPSLTMKDLSKLIGEISFASNKIYKSYDITDWRPTYYTVEDSLVAQNNSVEIKRNIKSQSFFSTNNYLYLKDINNAQWVKQNFCFNDSEEPVVNSFSEDISRGAFWGGTVTYFNMQLAYYMGIREIYLLGIDFHYPGLPERTLNGQSTFINTSEYENTHFIKDYNKFGESNYLPYLSVQYQAYCTAANFFKSNGVMVYNASRFSKLDVFPFIDIDDLLNA